MNIANLYVSLFFFLFLLACKKNNASIPIDADLKRHFNYQVGSYWIYKDSATGEPDTFTVVSNNFIKQYYSNSQSIDVIDIVIDESNRKNIWLWSLGSNIVKLQWDVRYDEFFTYPFQTGIIPDNIIDSGYVTNLYGAYTVSGKVYSNVAEISHSGTRDSTGHYNDLFYISPDAGIIKMRLLHVKDAVNKTLELQTEDITISNQ